MPPNATPLERAVDATAAGRFPLPTDLISATWDPDRCPADLLGYLANAYSIDLWFDDWSEIRKRQVIRDAFNLHRRKTTLAGIKDHVALVDAEVVKVTRPPSQLFASEGMTAAETEAWLETLPQLRMYPFDKRVSGSPETFCGPGNYLTDCYSLPTSGPDLHGTRATLYDRGVEKDIVYEQVEADAVRLTIPSTDDRPYLGAAYLTDIFAEPSAAEDGVVALNVSGDIGGFAVAAGLDPISIEPTRIFERYTVSEGQAFLGLADGRFLMPSSAARHIYDRVALNDPSRVASRRAGQVFLGHARLGYEPFQAELLVSVPLTRPDWCAARFAGDGYLAETDFTVVNRALTAINVSKAARDTILVDTATHKPVTFGDGLRLGTFRFGAYRKVF